MRRDELYVEGLLCNDAAKIIIDEEFKNDLKNKIMFGDKCNNITELPKRKNNFKQNRYFKIASGFVICVFVSGAIFNTIDIPSKSIAAKGDKNAELIMPIVTNKGLNETTVSKTQDPQNKSVKADSGSGNKQVVVATNSGNKTPNSPSVKTGETNPAKVNTDNGNSSESDDEINAGLVVDQKNASASTDPKVPIEVPKMDNVIKEDAGAILKCYDSRYSFDEKRLVSVKDDGIYVKDIESSNEKKLISYNVKTHIIDKPNFTPNDGIIYYKAEKVTSEKGTTIEKNGAIYLSDKNGEGSTKIVDGKNPMISKDGKNLVYEAEGKIYILTLATNNKKLVDSGKYPAWSDNGNLISYVKEEKETQSYDVNTEKKDVYIEKTFSSLWIFDLVTKDTRSLTNKEVQINNDHIESWAAAVRNGDVTTNFDITSRYSYFESIWGSNNKEIYVIRKNNEIQMFELIKFSLDN